ncbi:MAG: hypothetical protein F4107_01540 [Gemmatimonadetes bacterium]|nr:hypothetical protein [Rhodothermaceae bacterium]MXX59270.1 hypothetical protein [Rhodothermaceae bacterium]MYD19826.1 hypothetical protein [Rhodothermaceae bacterium]MYD56043.1 hypothetical protein [Rhodothermaceae bacterium]MYI64609.1 hypothetical protein [Gemmatimonadota bacterium]
MQKLACILAATLLFAHVSQAQETSELALKVTPAFKWTTDAAPYGDIQLSNPGTATAEITIIATGIEVDPDRTDAPQVIGDLSKHLTVFPPRLIIPPGETRIVRYAVMDAAPLSEGGYVALIHARMARRTPVDQLQTPSAATALRINYELVVPLILLKGVGEPEIVVQIASQDDEQIVLDLRNQGNSPWAGTVHVSSEDGQQSFGSGTVVIFLRRELEIALLAPLPDTYRVVFESDLDWIPEHSLRTPTPILVSR